MGLTITRCPASVRESAAVLSEDKEDMVVYVSDEDIDRLALANGYVKLAHDEIIAKRLTSGECVVKAADLETAVNELRDLCGPDCTSVAKLTAAIDAARKERE